jgi:hypothetical protein
MDCDERNGIVVRFGHFGIILDFKTKKEHFFHAKNCIGRKYFTAGDRVRFRLGEPRKVWDRKTRAEVCYAPGNPRSPGR